MGGMTCLGAESVRVFVGSNSVTNCLLVPLSSAAVALSLGFDLEGREKESFMIGIGFLLSNTTDRKSVV